jgi:diacylglycerol kinase (ATP)
VNPNAGAGRTGRRWPSIQAALREAGFDFEAALTVPGSAPELARRAAAAGWPLVVAVGGDGTANEVVAGLVDEHGQPRATLGLIVTGRGRDVCRNFGLETDPARAVRRLVEGTDAQVDVGVVEWPGRPWRPFLNAAGAGFDAVVARRAADTGGRGTIPYVRAVLASLLDHRPVAATIRVDGAPAWSGRLTAAVVANGASYGGGMRIAPGAEPADGRLELVVLGDLGRLELLRWLPTVYSGRHLANPAISIRPARVVTIETVPPVPVHLDGEVAGTTPVRVAVRPGALRLRR